MAVPLRPCQLPACGRCGHSPPKTPVNAPLRPAFLCPFVLQYRRQTPGSIFLIIHLPFSIFPSSMPESLRPTYLEVNLSQLRKNLEAIRAWVTPARVMPILKANAYGHGLDGVAKYIADFSDYLGVATLEEGIHLRQIGVDKPILVMGGTLPEQIPWFLRYDLTLTASSADLLRAADQYASPSGQKIRAHLKVDTGMERVGVRDSEAVPFLELAASCKSVEVEGIYSHFANADSLDLAHAKLQLERFQEVLRFYERRSLPPPPLRHISNSGGILQLPEANFDLVRPGIMFYGVYPALDLPRTVDVKPAITWRSRVAYSKVTPPGRPVSYGSTWQAERPTRIVTVPCGYADGYFRRMSGRARVLIHGKSYPQVGRICMDQFMVDGGDDAIALGDDVVLLGDGITAYDFAEWMGTSPYEVLTSISARVPRVFVNE
ncbi:MAG: alanine racemase [Anaerolineaceae bacterium]|nr:MAG: alanine racemase [Anaerolineaceae bacterium]